MRQKIKKPLKKWTGSPAVVRGENTLWRDTCDATARKYSGVQIVSSPYITTPEFRRNYADIFDHD